MKIEIQLSEIKSAFPVGIVHLRSDEWILQVVPARNQTGPVCPSAQCSPVLSRRGLLLFGIHNAHCHHFPVHSIYDKLYGSESKGNIIEPLLSLSLVFSSELISIRKTTSVYQFSILFIYFHLFMINGFDLV